MKVIGTGVGRTGTYSLKMALNQLGVGPCHHMEEVILNMPVQLPLWQEAVAGRPNWSKIFANYQSTVDWPSAGFYQSLYTAYPDAQFILTHRDPQSWVNSFKVTIYQLLASQAQTPAAMHEWLAMCEAVIARTGFPLGLSEDELKARFTQHIAKVRDVIPAKQLLLFEVKDGWQPLCEFLDLPVPDSAFPRTNHREEFWDKVSAAGD